MPRASTTHVKGLHRVPSGRHKGRFRIDLRWRHPITNEWDRYQELLPMGATLAAAKRRAQLVLSATLDGSFVPRKKDEPRRLYEAMDAYLAARPWDEKKARAGHGCASTDPRVVAAQKDRASRFQTIRRHIKDRPLSRLSQMDLERFKQDRIKAGLSAAGINRPLRYLLAAATWWAESKQGWITDAQLTSLRKVKLRKEPRGRVRELSAEEEAWLLEACGEGSLLWALALASVETGLRQANVRLLRKSEVDLRNQTITTRRTKTDATYHVPITPTLLPVLKEAMRDNDTPYVFVHPRTGSPYTKSGLRSAWKPALKASGVENFKWHDFRHTYASRLARGGTSLQMTADLLGHRSLQMAARYTHLDDAQKKAAVAAMRAK